MVSFVEAEFMGRCDASCGESEGGFGFVVIGDEVGGGGEPEEAFVSGLGGRGLVDVVLESLVVVLVFFIDGFSASFEPFAHVVFRLGPPIPEREGDLPVFAFFGDSADDAEEVVGADPFFQRASAAFPFEDRDALGDGVEAVSSGGGEVCAVGVLEVESLVGECYQGTDVWVLSSRGGFSGFSLAGEELGEFFFGGVDLVLGRSVFEEIESAP